MPDRLPKGWVKTTLGEIRRDDSFGISQQEMQGEVFELYSVPAFSGGKPFVIPGEEIGSNKIVVSPGDVLICKINPRINRAWVVGDYYPNPKIASPEWIVFSKQEGISSRFLCYFFTQDGFRNYLAANVSGVGGSLMRVRPAVIESHPIALPPTNEQSRIVATLDAALSRVAAGETAARHALDRLRRYRSAVLRAGVTGELTRDWRKTQEPGESGSRLLLRLLKARRARWEERELQRFRKANRNQKDDKWKSRYRHAVEADTTALPRLPQGWTWASVDQLAAHESRSIADGPFGSNLKSSHYTNSGPRVIRLQNIGDGVFIDEKAHISRKHYEFLKDHAVHEGDLVIRALGIPAPRACKIPAIGPAIVKADCIRFKVASEYVATDYVLLALNSEPTQLRTEQKIHGVGRPRLNLGEIKAIAIPLPPLLEQKRIVREVGRRLAAADQLTSTVRLELDRARATHQSLLSEAFAGKLVPQNSDDEPASILLHRIRAVREVEGKRMKLKRMPKTKIKITRRSLLDVLRAHKKPMSPELLFRESGFQQEFEDNEYRQDIVDKFYDELRSITGPDGTVAETRPNKNTVLLALRS